MSQSNIKRIIIDVDIGIDDAYAILAFLYAEKIGKVKIEAITLTQGNAALTEVTKNIIRLLDLLDRTDIPVYKGAGEPLIISDNPYLSTHHGDDGFGNVPHVKPPNLDIIQKQIAAVGINDIIKQNPGEISLVCLAALTNVALTFKLFPDFASNVKEIFILGGNYKAEGNTPTTAEYNFFMDPEAAYIVLASAKCPMTILPFETAMKSGIDPDWRFKKLGTIKSTVMELLNKAETGLDSTWYPFDCFLAAAVIYPLEIILKATKHHVTVELCGMLTRGQMILDHDKIKPPNSTIIKKINVEVFKTKLYEIMNGLAKEQNITI